MTTTPRPTTIAEIVRDLRYLADGILAEERLSGQPRATISKSEQACSLIVLSDLIEKVHADTGAKP